MPPISSADWACRLCPLGLCGTAIPGCAATSHLSQGNPHRQDCLCHWRMSVPLALRFWSLWHSHSWLCCRKPPLSQDEGSLFANRSPRILAAGCLTAKNQNRTGKNACATGGCLCHWLSDFGPCGTAIPGCAAGSHHLARTKARYLQTDPLESSLLGALQQRIKIAQARMPVPL